MRQNSSPTKFRNYITNPIDQSQQQEIMPSHRNQKNTFFGNDENISEILNKSDSIKVNLTQSKQENFEQIRESDSSEETNEQSNPFGNHIRVTKSPVPPLRFPVQPNT